jgi:tripartite-type tricarboxylate transporter receptor subunit TctC
MLLLFAVFSATAAAGYPKKNIEFVVGFKPGGGYSDWAQAIAPFIAKHLPNKVSVVVRHMEGAGSVIATNYLHKAKPDGYTIGIYNVSGLAPTQLVRKVQYDLNKVTWLARLSFDSYVATVNGKGPYKNIADFKQQTKPEYLMSTRGLSGGGTITGAITFANMGVKWKPLNHDGQSEAVLAVLRGDADILWITYESGQQYLDNGDLRALLYYDAKRHPALPDAPIPAESGMPELNEALNSPRLIGAPPGLPANIRAVLEEAIRKAVEDPDFQEAVKKMKKTTDYLNGGDTEKLMNNMMQSYGKYSNILRELFGKEKK